MTKILVLDDEEIVRAAARRALEPAGYWVKTTSSPREALDLTRTFSIDLVLSDLKMPGEMDGIEFLKRVKDASPATEVIIITGFGSVRGAVDALRYGAFDYLEKPVNPEDLLRTVGRCVERRSKNKKPFAGNFNPQRGVRALYSLENIIGGSAAMQKVFDLIAMVAAVDSTVLVTGQSGTGKELVSRAIHFNSPRREGPFVVIDCVTIPESIMESELFGHVKGSYTGADSTEKGLIETAGGGTLFFDEIGSLPLRLQGKLLRVLQEKEYRPVGARHTQKADVRFIAATNRDLPELVAAGMFREDFYYRLNVFPIKLPALGQRREDIPALVRHFLRKYSAQTGKDVESVSVEAMRRLAARDWPGNVREL
ncbi:MAG: sigma-54 dependent transcriptional regulator, partial [Nitrospiraceae bacterium]|nr:sigma-54 dependent transcriptional regulator [Nitrospiraceae bacterium]